MATVYPFRGFRYNPDHVGDLDRVVSQPYDKIDESDQENYYGSSPYNVVRLILNRDEDPYQAASRTLSQWIDEDVLIRDETPRFYAYYQEYTVNETTFTRRGFIGLGQLEEEEGVKAHEDTMEGPKADRLRLLRATETNFGHIFMLYSDSDTTILDRIDQTIDQQEPLIEVTDEDYNRHKVWPITKQELIQSIQSQMTDTNLYIADGHHRYETALNYRNECREKGWSSVDNQGFDNRMMTFINIDDPGLKVLATHRLIHDLDSFSPRGLLEQARQHFSIRRHKSREEMYQQLDQSGDHPVFGYRAKGGQAFWTLSLSDEQALQELMPDKSQAWRELDVSVLHKIVLDQYLGITEEDLEQKRNVDYYRYRDNALDSLEDEDYQAAFILNPTKVEEVRKIADLGEKMPQKSTDFYPKLLTGLVVHKLAIDKE